MVRRKIKWKFGVIFSILLLNVFTKSLPIDRSLTNVPNLFTNTDLSNLVIPNDLLESEETNNIVPKQQTQQNVENATLVNETANSTDVIKNSTWSLARQILRPGQEVRNYNIEITFNENEFQGRAMIDVRVSDDTRDDPLVFNAQDMDINSVMVGLLTEANAQPVDFDYDNEEGILEVSPERTGTTYVVIVEYTAPIRNDGTGLFSADFNGQQYLAMNLYPTYARRVFPCVDELTEVATVKFNFNDVPYNLIVANSLQEDNSPNEFRTLSIPLHLWGMVAHNFQTVMVPAIDVILRGRTGLNQDAQAIAAIQFYYNTLNEWTTKNYLEIIVNQDGTMNMFALPDTSVDWTALSTVCIWEPYVFMELTHSIAQRKTGLIKIAEAMARQWFGFVIYPENWRHEWAITGLRMHAVYDIVKEFQNDPFGTDTSMLDMNTIFVTDVIQESLLRDGYATAEPLLESENFFDHNKIRSYINGIIKYKAPAIIWMLRNLLGNEENDYIKLASQSLLNRWSLEPISSLDVVTAIENEWSVEPDKLIGNDLEEYLEPWITTRGFPVIFVDARNNRVIINQEQFGYNTESSQTYNIPLTFTTSANMQFDNIYPSRMMENTDTFNLALDIEEGDFVLFNIQGQGYYRVNYDDRLWFNILDCLWDPDCRQQIHPLNRATLIDDALNLARANRLDYDIALQVVLTMELETEYAPWKAFIRNMNFLKKRLEAFVFDDDDLDQDIYLRMVRRTITAVENEITFYPNPNENEAAMTSLTRGMVMDHACRAGYQPCIAAAIDWFYSDNGEEVNPDIPKDIRPAVYCAMVREGDDFVIQVLYNRLEEELSHWERLVILESLACRQDYDFIRGLLLDTIDDDSPYGIEERSLIFKAVAESSYSNAENAINFIIQQTDAIRNMYGGSQKLEECIYVLIENAADKDLTDTLDGWINSLSSRLDDSLDFAEIQRIRATENIVWDNTFRQIVYEWIDENDAQKAVISIALLCVSVFLTLFVGT